MTIRNIYTQRKTDDAILKQYKDRKVEELKKDFKIKDAEEVESKQKGLSRVSIGGHARYDAAKESIELTPTLAYVLNKRMLIGMGYQTNVALTGSDSLNTRGIRAFTEYIFLDTYFIHLESEWVKRNAASESGSAVRERNTYLGLGKNIKYKFINTSVMALYNFNATISAENQKV